MADLPQTLAQLVSAVMNSTAANPVPRQILSDALDALDQLKTDPAAAECLREQIAQAKNTGQVHINYMPIYLLQVCLPADAKGGAGND